MKNIQIGLHGAVIPQADLKTGLKAASQAGFNLYEPEVPKILECTPSQQREANTLRKQLGITWLPLNEVQAFCSSPKYRAQDIFTLASGLGISAVTVIPEPCPNGISFEKAVQELKQMAAMASKSGISLMFEMLGFQDRPFHTVNETITLAQAADIQIVIDTFHFIISGAKPDEIAALPKKIIGVVHFSDAISGGKALHEITDADRVLPGEGDLSLIEISGAIRRTGYQGGMSVEVFHPKYAKQDPYKVSHEAYRSVEELLRASGWFH